MRVGVDRTPAFAEHGRCGRVQLSRPAHPGQATTLLFQLAIAASQDVLSWTMFIRRMLRRTRSEKQPFSTPAEPYQSKPKPTTVYSTDSNTPDLPAAPTAITDPPPGPLLDESQSVQASIKEAVLGDESDESSSETLTERDRRCSELTDADDLRAKRMQSLTNLQNQPTLVVQQPSPDVAKSEPPTVFDTLEQGNAFARYISLSNDTWNPSFRSIPRASYR